MTGWSQGQGFPRKMVAFCPSCPVLSGCPYCPHRPGEQYLECLAELSSLSPRPPSDIHPDGSCLEQGDSDLPRQDLAGPAPLHFPLPEPVPKPPHTPCCHQTHQGQDRLDTHKVPKRVFPCFLAASVQGSEPVLRGLRRTDKEATALSSSPS